MKIKGYLGVFVAAIAGGLIAVSVYSHFVTPETKIVAVQEKQPLQLTNYPINPEERGADFSYAAEQSVHGVVHVTSVTTNTQQQPQSIFEYFFNQPGQGYEQRPQVGFGSGVIISEDGYIITNNHVIDNSDEISVTLNDKRKFDAILVGTDPSTDIAVLKIDADDLKPVLYGNSENIKVGEWVLAVGNPFNLNSTVTAGIVSAKARSINIIQSTNRIESFIQTDAAVNPGNSGGALVNTRGELIGINTAIASRTGSYSGYSFAVPVSIAKKVVDDIIEYGVVQRALMGVTIQNIDSERAKELNLDNTEGVYIAGVSENGGAKEAGIEEGDVVLEIDGAKVNSSSELQEKVSEYRPNDKVEVLIKRNNKEKLFNVTLRNIQGSTGIVKSETTIFGASFKEVPMQLKKKLRIRYGVQVDKIEDGAFEEEGIREDFIITEINEKPIYNVGTLEEILRDYKGGVFIKGVYPNGAVKYYAFGVN